MSIFSSKTVHSKTRIVLNTSQALLPRFKKFLLCLSLGFIFFGELSAQSVIVYDFKTGAFSAPIPYDELVTFKLIHINGIPDSVVFLAYEKKNLKDNTLGTPVLKKLIPKEEVRADSSVAFVSTTYFKPNRDYIFSVTAHLKSRGLNGAEKEKLKQAFVSDELIGKTMAELHHSAVDMAKADSLNVDYQKKAQQFLDNRILVIARNTLGTNVSFTSSQDSRSKFLSEVGTYGNKLWGVINAFKEATNQLENPKTKLAADTIALIKTALTSLENQIISYTEWPKTEAQTHGISDAFASINLKFNSIKDKYVVSKISALQDKWQTFIEASAALKSALAIDKVLAAIVSDLQIAVVANPSYPKAIKEQATGYFAIDFGMAYIPNIDKFVTFTQASFYFRPIKRSVPLRMYAGWDQLWARLSIDFGLTLNSIAEEDLRRGFSFDQTKEATNALMIGAGFRVLSFAKVNVGTMIYQSKELAQPETDYSYTGSFYIGVSIDLSLKGVVSENFGPKKVTPEE